MKPPSSWSWAQARDCGQGTGTGSKASARHQASRSSRRFAKILPAHQLKDKLIERHLRLVICAREPDQLAVKIHGVVAGLPVVDDLLAVHTLTSFRRRRPCRSITIVVSVV